MYITSDLFAFHKLQVHDEDWQKFLDSYLQHLPESLSQKDGVVLPGVPELLNRLSAREDMVLGLLTGNVELGARLKLRHFEIDHHFPFGGFGDRHHNRDDVARLALSAAVDYLMHEVHADRLWVIGDTPADIRCGRAIGAKVMAVATGIHPLEELQPHQADDLRASLADVEDVVRVLSN
jgi:phosphoglycolate phosphatase-like HAD superfamily hydrolase